MNILTDRLPSAVYVNGQDYAIRTDFRSCLRVIMAFEDPELAPIEKREVLLEVLYPVLPKDQNAAFEMGIKFLNCGEAASDEEGEAPKRLYSFLKDANLIFAAFQQTHGVDLETAEMHWWKFSALFMDLGQETTFSQLVGLRKRYKDGKATKEEKRMIAEMGAAFDVPEVDTSTLEQKAAFDEYMRLAGEG